MALIVKDYELPDKSLLENAYIKVNSISTSKVDYEFLQPIGDTEDLMTTWISKLETNVVVYVFADEIARRNQVAPLQYFQFQLDYNLTEWKNIFEQAYEYLKKKFPQGESV